MTIHPTILDPITSDIRLALAAAADAHVETGRRATVTLKFTVSRDPKTLRREIRARLSSVLPEGADDSHTRKGEPALLLSVTDDHPGQERIAGT